MSIHEFIARRSGTFKDAIEVQSHKEEGESANSLLK